METIKSVIEKLSHKQPWLQQYIEPIPNLPDHSVPIELPEKLLVVTKVKNAYRVDNLKESKSYVVSKVGKTVYCSCDRGKETVHCEHKLEVWKEAKRLQKLRVDECIKRKIAANMSSYIHRLRQIVSAYERSGDTQNSTYSYYKGKLSGLKLVLRIVIEA